MFYSKFIIPVKDLKSVVIVKFTTTESLEWGLTQGPSQSDGVTWAPSLLHIYSTDVSKARLGVINVMNFFFLFLFHQ